MDFFSGAQLAAASCLWLSVEAHCVTEWWVRRQLRNKLSISPVGTYRSM